MRSLRAIKHPLAFVIMGVLAAVPEKPVHGRAISSSADQLGVVQQ